MSKILLIGGEGYVGNVLSNYLLKKGLDVRSLDFLIYNNKICVEKKRDIKNYEFIYGDFRNSQVLNESLIDVEVVVLLAGLVGDPITKKYPEQSKKINYKGIQEAVAQISTNKNIKKFIFVSTCSNYGVLDENIKANEETVLNPVSDYSLAKVEAEKLIIKTHDTSKENYILRFATAFGYSDRMRFDLTVNEFTRELYLNNKLIIFDKNSWRPYCHTYDFANVIFKLIDTKLLDSSLKILNVGSNSNNYTKNDIVSLLSKKFKSIDVDFLEKGVDTRNYMVNFDRLNSIFPNLKFKSIEEGIDEIIFYLRNNYFDNFSKNINFYGNYKINYDQ